MLQNQIYKIERIILKYIEFEVIKERKKTYETSTKFYQ